MKSMKRIIKVMIAAALCAVIVLSGASQGAGVSYAAEKKPSLSVNFCGKTVKLIKDIYGQEDRVKVATMEKKWGKPNKKEKAYANNSEFFFTWRKGNSSILVNNFTGGDPGNVGGIHIEIKDKNASICGIKVGMKKQKALEKLAKIAREERVIVLKEGQQPDGEMDENGCLTSFTSGTGKATSNKEVIYVAMGSWSPMQVKLTKGGIVKEIIYLYS